MTRKKPKSKRKSSTVEDPAAMEALLTRCEKAGGAHRFGVILISAIIALARHGKPTERKVALSLLYLADLGQSDEAFRRRIENALGGMA